MRNITDAQLVDSFEYWSAGEASTGALGSLSLEPMITFFDQMADLEVERDAALAEREAAREDVARLQGLVADVRKEFASLPYTAPERRSERWSTIQALLRRVVVSRERDELRAALAAAEAQRDEWRMAAEHSAKDAAELDRALSQALRQLEAAEARIENANWIIHEEYLAVEFPDGWPSAGKRPHSWWLSRAATGLRWFGLDAATVTWGVLRELQAKYEG